MTDRIWIWFADNGNIRKWQSTPFDEGTEYVRATALADRDAKIAELEREIRVCCEARDKAGIFPASPSEAITMLAEERDALESQVAELTQKLERLVSAKALSGIRTLVAGWNGENLPQPHIARHPSTLGARIETNCGAIYELDEAMQEARAFLNSGASQNG